MSDDATLGLDHVEIREGYIEDLPVEDGWADTVISNGVINPCPDKQEAFAALPQIAPDDAARLVLNNDIRPAVPATNRPVSDVRGSSSGRPGPCGWLAASPGP